MSLTIIETLQHPDLFGGLKAFRSLTTWRVWLAYLRAVYGLAMDELDLELFRKHTGRQTPRPGGYPEAVCIVGCQSGKSQVAGVIAAFEAMLANEEANLSSERLDEYALVVAQDQRSALRTLFRYATAPFESLAALRQVKASETTETVTLSNGVTLAAYPCKPAAIRGIRARVVVVDELAFFVATDGRPNDTEMLRAARSRVATTGGKVIVLSSPYAQQGELWDLHRKHFGREDSSTLIWQASAQDMNPTLPADYLARMAEDDPDAYRSEVLGEFRTGTSTLFDPAALDDCVIAGRRELAPQPGRSYRAFVDPSGGRADAFTLAIGHQEGDRIVPDLVRAWPAPFNPTFVVAEVALTLKAYHVSRVTGDRYGGEWPPEAFSKHGIFYEPSELAKGDIYLESLPIVNAGLVELLDLPDVMREMRGLERRRGTAGRDRVDHRPGAHDDRANALCGLLWLLKARVEATLGSSAGPPLPSAGRVDYENPIGPGSAFGARRGLPGKIDAARSAPWTHTPHQN